MAENRREFSPLPVFVYGTLRPGEKNYPEYLQGKTVREEAATVAGELFFVAEGGYPYLLPGNGRVSGELMDLHPSLYGQVLQRLDALEEFDPADEGSSIYLRRCAIVFTVRGERREAWVYYWNCPDIRGAKIAGGDYRRRD